MRNTTILLFILFIAHQAKCYSIEGYFGLHNSQYISVNLENNQESIGILGPKTNSDPTVSSYSSITLDSSGNVYCIDNETFDICKIDDLSSGHSTIVANIPGIKNIEVANGAIYGHTSSALYTIQANSISKLCDLDNFQDIAVSENGRIIGIKYLVIDDPLTLLTGGPKDSGLYEIDQHTGLASRISEYVETAENSIFTSELLVSDSESVFIDKINASGDICFSNDGGFWLRYSGGIYNVDIDNLENFKGDYKSYAVPPWSTVTPKYGEFEYYPSTEYPLDTTNFDSFVDSFDVYVTPEPLSLLTLGFGAILLNRRK